MHYSVALHWISIMHTLIQFIFILIWNNTNSINAMKFDSYVSGVDLYMLKKLDFWVQGIVHKSPGQYCAGID